MSSHVCLCGDTQIRHLTNYGPSRCQRPGCECEGFAERTYEKLMDKLVADALVEARAEPLPPELAKRALCLIPGGKEGT